MRITIRLIIASLLMCLLFTGCEMQTANGELQGKWISYGGLSLDFTNNGKFKRTMPSGEVQNGTYVTAEDNITFHRTGFTSETLPYTLAFPILVIGDVTYYHDSARLADDLGGVWFGYYGMNSTAWAVSSLRLGSLTPKRDNPNVLEGVFDMMGMVKGEYTVSARNLPNSGVLTMKDTHIRGGVLASFIQNRLHVHLSVLFDQEALKPPGTMEWWFTSDEARKLFSDAARKASEAGDAALAQLVMNSMESFLGMYLEDTTKYNYTLMKVDGPVYDFDGYLIPGGDTVLTMITPSRDIITFINSGFAGGNIVFEDNRPATCTYTPADGLVCCRRPGSENNWEAVK